LIPLGCDWPVPDQFDMDLTNQPMVNSRYVVVVPSQFDMDAKNQPKVNSIYVTITDPDVAVGGFDLYISRS
jgi:hypothetical protein